MHIVDSHVHIWGADTPDRPWPPGRAPEAQRPYPVTKDMLLFEMDLAGVTRIVIVPPSWEGDRNDLALEAARLHPDRFAVMGRLDLRDPRSRDLVAGWKTPPGMLGMRFTFHNEHSRHFLTDGTADWLCPAAERAGIRLTVLVPGSLDVIDRIAARDPGLRLVIDHAWGSRSAVASAPGVPGAASVRIWVLCQAAPHPTAPPRPRPRPTPFVLATLRIPLAIYYFLRGLSLFFLLGVRDVTELNLFAILFGLNYISTVPPTSMLTADLFGRRSVGMLFGWIFFAHQIGTGLASYVGGLVYDRTGTYDWAFISAGILGVLAAGMVLAIREGSRTAPRPSAVPAVSATGDRADAIPFRRGDWSHYSSRA